MVICDKERVEAKQIYGALHYIFMKYGVVRSECLHILTSMGESPMFVVLKFRIPSLGNAAKTN